MGRGLIHGEEAGIWVAQRVKGAYFAARSSALGYAIDGEITAGVIYENYNAASVVAHIAVEGKRMSPYFVWAIFDYPFNQLGVNRITVCVGQGNASSRRFVEHLGFQLEANLSGAHPTGDLMIYRMFKNECRWIEAKHDQVEH